MTDDDIAKLAQARARVADSKRALHARVLELADLTQADREKGMKICEADERCTKLLVRHHLNTVWLQAMEADFAVNDDDDPIFRGPREVSSA